jgi:CubicO group peptidase (beta-lactamase class C family)
VLPEGDASLRQVLSHASASSPNGFKYDPARYALLTRAVEACEQQPYRRTLVRRIIDPLAMIDTVPGRDLQNASAVPDGFFEPPVLQRYAATLARLAVPYKVDARRRATRTELAVDGVNAATGIVSTVRDLARLDLAWDDESFLRPETVAAAWAPAHGPAGTWLPTGLGWFVQSYRGVPVVWQFGVTPNAYSALVVKVPSRRVTLILLANSDGLAKPSTLSAGDVTVSPFARLFLSIFTR